jgi:hypothetical protein
MMAASTPEISQMQSSCKSGSSCNVQNTAFVTICPVFVGNEALTAVVVKSTVLWDIMQCSPLKVN